MTETTTHGEVVFTSTRELREGIAKDLERRRQWINSRDDFRSRQDNADPNGDLVSRAEYVIFGWRTNSSEEDGTRVEARTPEEAGEALVSLLRSGHVQFTANRLGPDGRVAYPQKPL